MMATLTALAKEMTRAPQAGDPPLTLEEAGTLAGEVPEWTLTEHQVERTFKFKDFDEAMAFANKVADLAREADHHPDMHISYSKVRLELATHKIGGLSRNDFIMAARIDQLAPGG
jgi:4a-hydroxytetrahydrobiopterin dehydratase